MRDLRYNCVLLEQIELSETTQSMVDSDTDTRADTDVHDIVGRIIELNIMFLRCHASDPSSQ